LIGPTASTPTFWLLLKNLRRFFYPPPLGGFIPSGGVPPHSTKTTKKTTTLIDPTARGEKPPNPSEAGNAADVGWWG
ncbi:MAG: hypothetical protein ACFCD0_20175, partial [Gemmataceae bacterium]